MGKTACRVAVQYATRAMHLPTPADFRTWAQSILQERRDSLELTIRVVDEAESAALNAQYRGKQGPTNVLSFGFDAPPGVDVPLLGDLVICAPVVVREALEQGKPGQAHWAHMTIHGVLHLLGYDHQTPEQAQIMEALEIAALADLGYADPYLD